MAEGGLGQLSDGEVKKPTVLVVDDEPDILKFIRINLTSEGFEVILAGSGQEALEKLEESIPDLIISDVMMPGMDGLTLVRRLRSDPATEVVPLIFLSARTSITDVVAGLKLGADDYITKPVDLDELIARVHSKIDRPPLPRRLVPRDRPGDVADTRVFFMEVDREVVRSSRSSADGCVAFLSVYEFPRLKEHLGSRARADLPRLVAIAIGEWLESIDLLGRDDEDRFLILLPESDPEEAERRLAEMAKDFASRDFTVAGERLRLTPMIGFANFLGAENARELADQCRTALSHSAADLNLRPFRYEEGMEDVSRKVQSLYKPRPRPRWRVISRAVWQISATFVVGIFAPYAAYWALDRAGYDVTPVMYLVVVVSLSLTALLIWLEGIQALKAAKPPERIGAEYPPASAVIVAFLPNEAATIVESIEAFLRVEYPSPLEIILAYNTPQSLPVEQTFRDIAARYPNFKPRRIGNSNSKAQNLNAALSEVTGEFVGIFDADHHPSPDSFRRAWKWLSNGYDVVQGHCLVRNGDASWITQLVAVEFEHIYAVSHPGRAKLHGFGIFGGSNGFWKTSLIRETRMHGFMLTEDIDSSMRVVVKGYKIASDPGLISTELAPSTVTSLWNQRMRWAQGWFQVSLEYLFDGLRSKNLTGRQKLGFAFLLGWRELYPWLSLQMFPIIAFWVWKYRGLDRLDWLIPIFIVTTLFTLSVGPGQTYLAWRLAAPDIKEKKKWFVYYLLASTPIYTEFKNLIVRVSQMREAMKQRDWRVTPRPR